MSAALMMARMFRWSPSVLRVIEGTRQRALTSGLSSRSLCKLPGEVAVLTFMTEKVVGAPRRRDGVMAEFAKYLQPTMANGVDSIRCISGNACQRGRVAQTHA
jgi:hypothetical protein